MNTENTFNSIADFMKVIPENYMIMEETIDLDVQKEYFQRTTDIDTNPEIQNLDELMDHLNNEQLPIEEVKDILIKLALTDKVEAYRAIEKYNKKRNNEIKDWAILALQQSRMLIQSSLLQEQQVFISTGLGGKQNKLRYFLIFPYNNADKLNKTQQETLESELKFFTNQNDGEFEDIRFDYHFASSMVLFPLQADIPTIINNIISESNQLGNFLSQDVLITNTKRFERDEILEILKKDDQQEN